MAMSVDPDESLLRARAAAGYATRIAGVDDRREDYADYLALALSHYEELDEWMARGGYPPKQWTSAGERWSQ